MGREFPTQSTQKPLQNQAPPPASVSFSVSWLSAVNPIPPLQQCRDLLADAFGGGFGVGVACVV